MDERFAALPPDIRAQHYMRKGEEYRRLAMCAQAEEQARTPEEKAAAKAEEVDVYDGRITEQSGITRGERILAQREVEAQAREQEAQEAEARER